MKLSVQILLYPHCRETVALGCRDILADASDDIEVSLVSSNESTEMNCGGVVVKCQHSLSNAPKADIVVIPPFGRGRPANAIGEYEDLSRWLAKCKAKGSEICALCTGNFLLAQSGVLNGTIPCTTHWMYETSFEECFPNENLQISETLIDFQGIYSGGGALSYLYMMLYLVQKFVGKEAAVEVSKLYLLPWPNLSQNVFMSFKENIEHGDAPIESAQDYIRKNYPTPLRIAFLADLAGLGERNFIHRFKKATAVTPARYIQQVRIENAKRKLELTNLNVNEVMYSTGYNDSKYFRMVFARITGMTPSDYKKRYQILRAS